MHNNGLKLLRNSLDAVVTHSRTLIGADVAVLLLADGEGRLRHAASSDPAGAIDRTGGGEDSGDEIFRFVPAGLFSFEVPQLERPLERLPRAAEPLHFPLQLYRVELAPEGTP